MYYSEVSVVADSEGSSKLSGKESGQLFTLEKSFELVRNFMYLVKDLAYSKHAIYSINPNNHVYQISH